MTGFPMTSLGDVGLLTNGISDDVASQTMTKLSRARVRHD